MRRLLRSWPQRVAVEGHSMEPALRAGDWLMVDPLAYRRVGPAAGDLVVAADPDQLGRWLVKRVHEVLPDGSLMLAGDHPGHAAEQGAVIVVSPAAIAGRPWLRYWPLRRAGGIA